jgi:hypothetical protein
MSFLVRMVAKVEKVTLRIFALQQDKTVLVRIQAKEAITQGPVETFSFLHSK